MGGRDGGIRERAITSGELWPAALAAPSAQNPRPEKGRSKGCLQGSKIEREKQLEKQRVKRGKQQRQNVGSDLGKRGRSFGIRVSAKRRDQPNSC